MTVVTTQNAQHTTQFRAPGPFDPSHGHEQVVYCNDAATGLRAIIAIHSTRLGPGRGGTRIYPYKSEEAALADALQLSRGMTSKNALAELDYGGGKGVIIADPRRDKTEALLRSYGRFIDSLGGRYITACDSGTNPDDMETIHKETRHVVGRPLEHGGAGDSGELTAHGVFVAMNACAEHVWGESTLRGRTVGVAGVGNVGYQLVEALLADGARVVVTDVSQGALDRVHENYPYVEILPDTEALVNSPLDVYAPCAMGGALDADTVNALQAQVVCGSANNQLVDDVTIPELMLARDITYAPDYLVNAGGVIQVGDELEGYHPDRARHRVDQLFGRTLRVLKRAQADGTSPAVAADHIVDERISMIGSSRIYRAGKR